MGFTTKSLDIPLAAFRDQNKWILQLFNDVAKKYPVKFIWPHTALCEETCGLASDGRALYFDHNHLSVFGADKTSKLYDPIFSKR